jgi:hypothetical protein
MKYTRRADEDRIAELNAKIEGIRERAERRAARANPGVRQATIALRAIERALREDQEDNLRAALDTAAGGVRTALGTAGPRATKPEPEPAKPARRQRAKREATPAT